MRVAEPSPRYVLAAAIRSLNAKLSQLPAERQAEMQREWLDSWDVLTRERENASEPDELAAIKAWLSHWTARLRD
jgi:hypothetical protein